MHAHAHTHTTATPASGTRCALCERAEAAAPKYVPFVEVAYRVALHLTKDQSEAERLTNDALRSALDEEAAGIRVETWPKKRLLGHVRSQFLSHYRRTTCLDAGCGG